MEKTYSTQNQEAHVGKLFAQLRWNILCRRVEDIDGLEVDQGVWNMFCKLDFASFPIRHDDFLRFTN